MLFKIFDYDKSGMINRDEIEKQFRQSVAENGFAIEEAKLKVRVAGIDFTIIDRCAVIGGLSDARTRPRQHGRRDQGQTDGYSHRAPTLSWALLMSVISCRNALGGRQEARRGDPPQSPASGALKFPDREFYTLPHPA